MVGIIITAILILTPTLIITIPIILIRMDTTIIPIIPITSMDPPATMAGVSGVVAPPVGTVTDLCHSRGSWASPAYASALLEG